MCASTSKGSCKLLSEEHSQMAASPHRPFVGPWKLSVCSICGAWEKEAGASKVSPCGREEHGPPVGIDAVPAQAFAGASAEPSRDPPIEVGSFWLMMTDRGPEQVEVFDVIPDVDPGWETVSFRYRNGETGLRLGFAFRMACTPAAAS